MQARCAPSQDLPSGRTRLVRPADIGPNAYGTKHCRPGPKLEAKIAMAAEGMSPSGPGTTTYCEP